TGPAPRAVNGPEVLPGAGCASARSLALASGHHGPPSGLIWAPGGPVCRPWPLPARGRVDAPGAPRDRDRSFASPPRPMGRPEQGGGLGRPSRDAVRDVDTLPHGATSIRTSTRPSFFGETNLAVMRTDPPGSPGPPDGALNSGP